MILKDGIYEVEDLFYENAGYMLAIIGGEPDFVAEDTVSIARFKLEVLHPELDFSKPTKVPGTVSSERCEFDKNLVKTIFSVGTEDKIAKCFSGILKIMTKCSLFELTFITKHLSSGGLVFMTQYKGMPVGRSPGDIKIDQIDSVLCHIFLNNPSFFDFNRSRGVKAEHGDPEDIKLYRKLTKAPHYLKPIWEWTEKDAEECLTILASKPFFRKHLYT